MTLFNQQTKDRINIESNHNRIKFNDLESPRSSTTMSTSSSSSSNSNCIDGDIGQANDHNSKPYYLNENLLDEDLRTVEACEVVERAEFVDPAILCQGPSKLKINAPSRLANRITYTRQTLLLFRDEYLSQQKPNCIKNENIIGLGIWITDIADARAQNSYTGGFSMNSSNSDRNLEGGSQYASSVRGTHNCANNDGAATGYNYNGHSRSMEPQNQTAESKCYLDQRSISSTHLMPSFIKRRIGTVSYHSTPPTEKQSNLSNRYGRFGNSAKVGANSGNSPSGSVTSLGTSLNFSTNNRHSKTLFSSDNVDTSLENQQFGYNVPNSEMRQNWTQCQPNQSQISRERRIGSGRIPFSRDWHEPSANQDFRNTLERSQNNDDQNFSANSNLTKFQSLIGTNRYKSSSSYDFRNLSNPAQQHETNSKMQHSQFEQDSQFHSRHSNEQINQKQKTQSWQSTQQSQLFSKTKRNSANLSRYEQNYSKQSDTSKCAGEGIGKLDEPEWFSGGPTSQLDTIELRGFDDCESNETTEDEKKTQKLRPKKPNKLIPRYRNANTIAKDKIISAELDNLRHSNELEKNIDLNKNINKNDASSADVSELSNASSKKIMLEESIELNFEVFLNCDPLLGASDNTKLDNNSQQSNCSRFSRWFNTTGSSAENSEEQAKKQQEKNVQKLSKHEETNFDLGNQQKGNSQEPQQSLLEFFQIGKFKNLPQRVANNNLNGNQQEPTEQYQNLNQEPTPPRDGYFQHKQTKKIITSVEELEARMRSATSHLIEIDSHQQLHKPQQKFVEELFAKQEHSPSSTNSLATKQHNEVEAFKHLLKKIQQPTEEEPQLPQQQQELKTTFNQQHHPDQQQQQQEIMCAQELLQKYSHVPPEPGVSIKNLNRADIMNRPEAQALLHGLAQGEFTQNALLKLIDINDPISAVCAQNLHYQRNREIILTVISFIHSQQKLAEKQQQLKQIPQTQSPIQFLNQKIESPTLLQQKQSQRIPSPRELQHHTQSILQNALIRKRLEEQTENYRRLQENQQQLGDVFSNQQQQQFVNNSSVTTTPANTPTKFAFTPTSVLRKMTAEKDLNICNNGLTGGNTGRMILGSGNQKQQPILGSGGPISPQKQQQLFQHKMQINQWISQSMPPNITTIPATISMQKVNQNIMVTGRPILKGGCTSAAAVIPQNTNLKQQTIPNQFPMQNSQSKIDFSQQEERNLSSISHATNLLNISNPNMMQLQQPPANPQIAYMNSIQQQQQQQHQHQQQQQQQQQQHQHLQQLYQEQQRQRATQAAIRAQHQFQQKLQQTDNQPTQNQLMQQFSHAAILNDTLAQHHNPQQLNSNGGLSPTSNQLAQWFSPELLAQASAGKLPSLNIGQALSLEEFERSIQNNLVRTATTSIAATAMKSSPTAEQAITKTQK